MKSGLSGNLARNARQLRERRAMTLSQLSERSGIAKATLSQIESGVGNPTLSTLRDLAVALSTDADLLLSSKDGLGMVVVRSGQGIDVSDDAANALLVHTTGTNAAKLEIHRLTILAGRREVSASHGIGARELVVVSRGSVRLGPVGEEQLLHEGDFADYRVDGPHTWETTDGNAVVWVTLVQPG